MMSRGDDSVSWVYAKLLNLPLNLIIERGFPLRYIVRIVLTIPDRRMLESSKPRHYLAQFYGANDNPKVRYRKTNLAALAVYPNGGVKSFSSLQVRIVGICETGALVQAGAVEFLPDHFYLSLGNNELVFTCAKRNVVKDKMVVTFSRPEDTFFINALAKGGLPLMSLKRMRASTVVRTRTARSGHNG